MRKRGFEGWKDRGVGRRGVVVHSGCVSVCVRIYVVTLSKSCWTGAGQAELQRRDAG